MPRDEPPTVRVLGIDPGLNVTGYAVIDWQEPDLRLAEGGVIRAIKSDDLGQRLLSIAERSTGQSKKRVASSAANG